MSGSSHLPKLRLGETAILTDVLVTEHGVAVEPKRVHIQRVEQQEGVRRRYDEAGGAADILAAPLDL